MCFISLLIIIETLYRALFKTLYNANICIIDSKE